MPTPTTLTREPGYRRVLIPDLPVPQALTPFLRRMHDARQYSNFGPLHEQFREELAAFLGVPPECVALTSSGTTALELGLRALTVPGGETLVRTPAFTFPATVTAIVAAQGAPVYADVSETTWTLAPESHQFWKSPGAAVPVAAFGWMPPQELREWRRVSAARAEPVLVDAAAGCYPRALTDVNFAEEGARRFAVALSLHATKALPAGEGGVLVAHPEVADAVRRLTNFGIDRADPFQRVREFGGANAKLSEYHAAVGLASLQRYAKVAERRQELARFYQTELRRYLGRGATWVTRSPACVHTVFPVRLKNCRGEQLERVRERLRAAFVETRRWYYPPASAHPGLPPSIEDEDCPVTRQLAEQVLCVPFHTRLTYRDVIYVCGELARAVEREVK